MIKFFFLFLFINNIFCFSTVYKTFKVLKDDHKYILSKNHHIDENLFSEIVEFKLKNLHFGKLKNKVTYVRLYSLLKYLSKLFFSKSNFNLIAVPFLSESEIIFEWELILYNTINIFQIQVQGKSSYKIKNKEIIFHQIELKNNNNYNNGKITFTHPFYKRPVFIKVDYNNNT